MHSILEAIRAAVGLIASGDATLGEIVLLSLSVSLTRGCAGDAARPAARRGDRGRTFPGRRAVIVLLNALMGLPPVVVGLVVYLLLSRAGPLGELGLLFTPRRW